MTIDFEKYHPIVSVNEQIVLANNGNLCLCYRLELPEVYNLSEADYDEIQSLWYQALKQLPVGTIVHKQDVYQKTLFKTAAFPKKTFLQNATVKHFKDRPYLQHDSFVYFIWPKNKGLNNARYVNPFVKVAESLIFAYSEVSDSIIIIFVI